MALRARRRMRARLMQDDMDDLGLRLNAGLWLSRQDQFVRIDVDGSCVAC